jgi:hydroxymethylglutaryl-CoA lyase
MGYPKVHIRDETMRDGMQIESADIPVESKIALIEAMARTGLAEIVIGSFVSPKYTPQMAQVDDIVRSLTPVEGVRFTAPALNQKGRERAAAFTPPLAPSREVQRPSLGVHMCETFSKRNSNVIPAQEVAGWPARVQAAVDRGAKEASISLQAAFGSNFEGHFTDDERMEMLAAQHQLWTEAGIPVTGVQFADPMSWAMPHRVKALITRIHQTWPEITHWVLHLHNGRGVAMTSLFTVLEVLDERHDVYVDASMGGIGGCPYGGTGQATSMIPTEDLVVLLEEMGIPTGVDIRALIRCVWQLEEVLGRATLGHVSKNGWLPHDDELWDPNLPAVETFLEATHFLRGEEVLGDRRPWREPIPDRRGKPRNIVL